jgi:DNA primase large subunit
MLRHDHNRAESKRRHVVDHRKQQFAEPAFKQSTYPSRLNFYRNPPTADITLEEFEQWAIDRLKGMPSVPYTWVAPTTSAPSPSHTVVALT